MAKLEGDAAHRNMQNCLETSKCQKMMRGDSSASEGANHLHKVTEKKLQRAWAVVSPCLLSGPLAVPAALQSAAGGRKSGRTGHLCVLASLLNLKCLGDIY